MKRIGHGLLVFVAVIIISVIAVLSFGTTDSANSKAIPTPAITISLPPIVKTVIKRIPGPTKTVKVPVPGPTKTKVVRLPSQTKTVTVRPTPTPAATITVTIRPKQSKPKTIVSVKPEVSKSIVTNTITKYKTRQRVREVALTVGSILLGMLLLVIGVTLTYYLGRKQGDQDNVGFLTEMLDRLRRKG